MVGIRWQVSAKAHRTDCRTAIVPCRNRVEDSSGMCRPPPVHRSGDRRPPGEVGAGAPGLHRSEGQAATALRPASARQEHHSHASTYGYHFSRRTGWRAWSTRRARRSARLLPAALLHPDRPGPRRSDARGLALAGSPIGPDHDRHLRAPDLYMISGCASCGGATSGPPRCPCGGRWSGTRKRSRLGAVRFQ